MRQVNVNIVESELFEFMNNIQKHAPVDNVVEMLGLTQLGFFIGIFGFFSTPAGKAWLMMKPLIGHQPLQVYLFPLMIVLELGDTGAALYRLVRADNRNLDKTLEFSNKATKASIITSAITIGVIAQVAGLAALGAVVPYIFVAAIAINTLYSIGSAIYHAVMMMKAPKGSALRAAHQQALIKDVVGSIAGAVLIGAIVGLMVVGVSTGVGLAVIAGIGIATLIGVFVVNQVMKHRAKKAALQSAERKYKNPQPSLKREDLPTEKQEAITTVFKGNANASNVEGATRAEGDQNDRLYVRDLSRLLNAAKQEGPIALRNAFINVIDIKVAGLNQQIQDAKGKARTRNRLFKVVVPNEELKRRAKIDGLNELRQKIESYKGRSFEPEDISSIAKKYKGIFQSFFHDKSDVELIFDAAKEYFASTAFSDRFDTYVTV